MHTEQELAQLSTLVGAPVVAAARASWGFENHTTIATLADGRRLVVQRIASRTLAGYKLLLAEALPARLAAVGILAPRQLGANANADRPYAVREYLPGEPGASQMGTIAGATRIARAMGALIPRLAAVDIAGVELDTSWASPASLAARSRQRLARCRALLDAPIIAALEGTIAELPERFAGRPAVFAHGDFCPVNVLIQHSDVRTFERLDIEVAGLLDLEFARLADLLFDAAWWGWVVRYHHPERWLVSWPHLLAAAGIASDATTLARVQALQRLRCLEMIDYHAHDRRPEVAAMWVERLGVTMGWD